MINKFTYQLFGRSKGRGKINKISSEAIKLQIKKIDSSKYNIIDIGSGYGESTIELAKNDTSKFVIACEKYIDGINKIAQNTRIEKLFNVSIFHGNVNQFLDQYCLSDSITEIWILFPDPWPKKRHFKRRLINISFLNRINIFLKKNATIHIASDSKSYISEILNCIDKSKNDFLWVNQMKEDWDYANLTLPKTKYFKKALENGLNPMYIKLLKL